MSTAQVDSIDPIRDFRVYLMKFREMAGRALSDADSDVNRMMRWLEGEGANYWAAQARKRQEAVVKAEEAFRQKRLYKDASGSTPSAVEEMKALKIAKDRLQEAVTKQQNVKKWTRELQKQATLYRGQVSQFSNDVASGIPEAYAFLGAILEQLDKYLDLTAATSEEQAAGAGADGAGVEASGASMSRAADEGPAEKSAYDPALLRAAIPSQQAMAGAKPMEAGPIRLATGTVSAPQSEAVSKIAAGSAPADGQQVVIAVDATRSIHVLIVRIDQEGAAWYLGPVEAGPNAEYHKVPASKLLQDRPDLAEILKMPGGFMSVIGGRGVEAVFDSSNQSVLKSA
jgi:hypothetical protein